MKLFMLATEDRDMNLMQKEQWTNTESRNTPAHLENLHSWNTVSRVEEAEKWEGRAEVWAEDIGCKSFKAMKRNTGKQ